MANKGKRKQQVTRWALDQTDQPSSTMEAFPYQALYCWPLFFKCVETYKSLVSPNMHCDCVSISSSVLQQVFSELIVLVWFKGIPLEEVVLQFQV